MAPNENATSVVVEECVALQEPIYPSSKKPQIIAAEKYDASARSAKRFDGAWAISRQVSAQTVEDLPRSVEVILF